MTPYGYRNNDLGYIAGVVLGLAAVAWVAIQAGGRLASLLSGYGWQGPAWGDGEAIGAVVRNGPPSAWPAVSPVLVWVCIGAHVVAVMAAAYVAWNWSTGAPPSNEGQGLAVLTDPAKADRWQIDAKAARKLRPSLSRRHRPDARGLALGAVGKATLWASWESTVVALMAPRAGKTSAVAVPSIVAAPGPVIATSNKPDLVAITAEWREANRGRVWVFDPQNVAGAEPSWTWDPLGSISTRDDALTLAAHFVPMTPGVDPMWPGSARDLMALLFLAAASSGRPVGVVGEWLDTNPADAVDVLVAAELVAEAQALETLTSGPAETFGGVVMQAKSAAQVLRSPEVLAWVTPDDRPRFDVAAFIESTESLYLLSEDRQGSAGPLLAAFVAELMTTATRHAADLPAGRLDPPMVAVLDEAANVCRIEELPALYSHLGSRGVVPITILQSRAQGQGVWGRDGMAALWSAATVQLIGPGLRDATHAREISDLLGTVRVVRHSKSHGRQGSTDSTSWTDEPVLTVGQVANLDPETVLVMGAGVPTVLARQLRYYDGPHRKALP